MSNTVPPPPRVPANRRRGQQPTLTPARLGGVASAILQGDTIKAACASALVPAPTYQSWIANGEKAINDARNILEEQDIEGLIWEWIHDGGGFGTASPTEWYWTAEMPSWWPSTLDNRWSNALFVMVIYWARGKAEQIYRSSITKAAQGNPAQGIDPDWKAAQFMLTHSFHWRSAERLEITGANGGAIETKANEEQVLNMLAMLAERRKTIEQ